jgi:hypothetical protein
MIDPHDSLWIMTRAEIDVLRSKLTRAREVLETTRALSDQRAVEIEALRAELKATTNEAIEVIDGKTTLLLQIREWAKGATAAGVVNMTWYKELERLFP